MKSRNLMMLALCLPLVACSPDTGTSGSDSSNPLPSENPSSEVEQSSETPSTSENDGLINIENLDVTSEEHLNWFGRTYAKDGKRYFHYSSSGFEVRFTGTKLEATIGATGWDTNNHKAYISVLIDDNNDPRDAINICLDQEIANYTIVKNLPNGLHTVRVLKRSESQYNKCYLEELTTDGVFHNPKAKKTRRIEVFGASTTCGFGVFGKSGPEKFTTATQSSLFSFGGFVSRAFDAEYNMVSASGWAITQNKVNDTVSMLNCYDKMDLRSKMDWDMKKFVPDIIMVNLATNDSVYIDDAPTYTEKLRRQKRYYDGYIQFIDGLREAYGNPELPILMTYGFLDDQGVAQPIHDIKAYYAKKGDAYVDFLKVIKANNQDGFGSAFHPSATTHMRSADLIIPKVQEMMDNEWDVVYPNLTSVTK